MGFLELLVKPPYVFFLVLGLLMLTAGMILRLASGAVTSVTDGVKAGFAILFLYTVVICSLGADSFMDVFVNQFATGSLWLAISGMGFFITLALFIVGYFGFYRQKKYYVISIPSRILFIIWVIIFATFPIIPAAMSGDYYTLSERYEVMSFMFGIGLVTLGLAAPVIVVIASAERSMREKNKSQEAYLAAELDYIEQYKRKQTETKAFRHDVKNHLAMTSMMLEEGHVDEAREHIQNMLGKVSALSPQYVSGDEILDIIISMKADRMNELGVRFTLDGVVDGGLNIKPMDKCSIFANALDNAIEAASACEDPYVSFEIKRTEVREVRRGHVRRQNRPKVHRRHRGHQRHAQG